jgi:pyrimidine oxygenase
MPAGSQSGVRARSAVSINVAIPVGSFANVAAMLDGVAGVPGCGDVLLTFDDFRFGVDVFERRKQPLLRFGRHIGVYATTLKLAS